MWGTHHFTNNLVSRSFISRFLAPAILLAFIFLSTGISVLATGFEGNRSEITPLSNRLPGSIDQTGALTHDVAIAVPPGRNGLQPSLALSYNSGNRANDSVFGYGWSHSIPRIERINRTGVDNLYSSDLYFSSLDGELDKLDATTYRPKVETGSFNRYKLVNGQWTVTNKDGTVHKFGHAASARQDDPNDSSRVFAWMLEETRDTNDNYIAYSYYKNSGQIYPDVITYTGHGSTDGIFDVHFDRETRTDSLKSYAPGFLVQTNYRIYEIRTEVNDDWARKYEITYDVGDNGNRSIITDIVESGKNDQGTIATKPSTSFTYKTSPDTWTDETASWTIPELFVWQNADQATRLADVNGDGLTDMLRSISNSSVTINKVYINDGTSLVHDTSWSLPVSILINNSLDNGVQVVDVNGDALADIVRNQFTYINTGSGWSLDSTWTIPMNIADTNYIERGVRFGDVNGDGLIDVIQSYDHATGADTQSVHLNNGSGWTYDASWSIPVNFIYQTTEDHGARLIDVNGDGLDDIVQSFTHSNSSQHPTIQKVYINTGTSWAHDTAWNLPMTFRNADFCFTGANLADINSDGLPDFIDNDNVWLNTGSGWSQDTSWTIPDDFAFSCKDQGSRLVDLDGDNALDFVRNFEFNSTVIKKVFISNTNETDRIEVIDHSKGGSTEIEYKQSALYEDDLGNKLNPNLPFNLDTVATTTQNDGMGNSYSTSKIYSDGHFYYASPTDRKFAGFGAITEEDDAGTLTTTKFHQGNSTNSSEGEYSDHISKAGQPYLVEVTDDQGNLFTRTISKWDFYDMGSGSRFVKLIQTIEQTYDGDSDHKDLAQTFTHDNSTGNVLTQVHWGEVTGSADGTFTDVGSDKRTTTYSYTTNAVDHILGLVVTQMLEDQGSNKVAETLNYYDNQALGGVTDGNLTKSEQWVAGSTYIDTERTYNTYGLVATEKDPRDKTTTYSYDINNLYPTTITNPLSQSTTQTFDYSNGKVTTITDPNGHTFGTIYDGFDRVLEEQQPDIASPSTLVLKTSYVYNDFTSPISIQQTDHLDTSNSVVTYSYFDGLDRIIQKRTEAQTAGEYVAQDFVYNNIGLLKSETLPYFSSGTTLTAASTTPGLVLSFEYDAARRQTATVNAVGTTTTAYDDWTTETTDAEGNSKKLHRDAFNNLVQVDEHNATSTYVTTYEYDELDNLTKLTDALGNVRNFVFDGLSRRTSAEDLHAPGDSTFGTWSYVYDAAGNVTSQTDPNGSVTTFTYDDLNRVTGEDSDTGGGVEITFLYDTCDDGIGRMCRAARNGVTIHYGYNALGLLKHENHAMSGEHVFYFEYDRQGNQTNITYPDNSEVQYVYNSAGLLETVQKKEDGESSFSNIWLLPTYTANGELEYYELGDGSYTYATYDPNEIYRQRYRATFVPEQLGGVGGDLSEGRAARIQELRTLAAEKIASLDAGELPWSRSLAKNDAKKEARAIERGQKLSKVQSTKKVLYDKSEKPKKFSRAEKNKLSKAVVRKKQKKIKISHKSRGSREIVEYDEYVATTTPGIVIPKKQKGKWKNPSFYNPASTTKTIVDTYDTGFYVASTTDGTAQTSTPKKTKKAKKQTEPAATTTKETVVENKKETSSDAPVATSTSSEAATSTPIETIPEPEQGTTTASTSPLANLSTIRVLGHSGSNAEPDHPTNMEMNGFWLTENLSENHGFEESLAGTWTYWTPSAGGGTQTITIRPDSTTGKDSFYADGYGGSGVDQRSGMGDQTYAKVGDGAYNFYTFIEFDLSGAPAANDIQSAHLEFYNYHSQTGDALIKRIEQSWTESGISDGSNPSSTSHPSISAQNVPSGYWSADITDLVKDWQDGTYTNYGVEIEGQTTGKHYKFRTSEWGTENQRPALVIEEITGGGGGNSSIAQDCTESYEGNCSVKIVNDTAGLESDTVLMQQIRIDPGVTYTLKFYAKALATSSFVMGVGENHSPFQDFGLMKSVTVGTGWQEYEYTFTSDNTAVDEDGRIYFGFGADDETYYLDDVRLTPNNRNLTTNPSFEMDAGGWASAVAGGAAMTFDRQCYETTDGDCRGKATITTAGTDPADLKAYHTGIPYQYGSDYILEFDAKGAAARDIYVTLLQSDGITEVTPRVLVPISNVWASYQIELSPTVADTDGALAFLLGNAVNDVALDNIRFSKKQNLAVIDNDNPDFTAIFDDQDATDDAVKYQVQVIAEDGNFTSPFWDSGEQTLANTPEGSRTSAISYGGPNLETYKRYYWRIKLWDDAGHEGPWSNGWDYFDVGSGDKVQEYTFAYDRVGNLTQIVDSSDTPNARNYVYGYDDLYRLTTISEAESYPSYQGGTGSGQNTVTTIQPGGTDGEDTFYGDATQPGPYGSSATLKAGGNGGNYKWYSFFKFDLDQVPSASEITHAEISIYVHNRDDPNNAKFYRVDESWSEDTLTRSNAPSSVDYGMTSVPVPDADWFTADVTDLVKDWKDGTHPNYGVKMMADDYTSNQVIRMIAASHINESQRPKLVVTSNDGGEQGWYAAATTTNLVREYTYNEIGNITSITGDGLVLPAGGGQSTQTITIQPDSSGKDGFHATAFGHSQDDGQGDKTFMKAGTNGNNTFVTNIEFDLNQVPQASDIQSAHMELYNYRAASALGTILRTNQSWTESGLAWNNNPTAVSHPSIPAQTVPSEDWWQVDITDLVKEWKDGTYPNYGVEVTGPSNQYFLFRSSDHTSDPTLRPKLVIEEIIGGGGSGTTSVTAFTYLYEGDQGNSYANPHAMTDLNGDTFTYDNNGNLLTDNQHTNVWDWHNNLTQSTIGGAIEEYRYDAFGIRSRKIKNGVEHFFMGELYDLWDGSKATKHIFAGPIHIADVEGTSTAAQLNYQHTDHLGSTRVVTRSGGEQIQHLDYWPFGDPRVDNQLTQYDSRNKFTGHELDRSTDYTYAKQRYYNAEYGRFISQDKAHLLLGVKEDFEERYGVSLEEHLSDPQLLNSYSYTANRPLAFVDPDGEHPLVVLGIAALVGVGLQYYDDVVNNDGKISTPDVYARTVGKTVGTTLGGIVAGPGGAAGAAGVLSAYFDGASPGEALLEAGFTFVGGKLLAPLKASITEQYKYIGVEAIKEIVPSGLIIITNDILDRNNDLNVDQKYQRYRDNLQQNHNNERRQWQKI